MMPDDLKSRGLSLIVVEVSLLITLNILSLVGTTLVCISICKNNRLRTTTNLFIMVLAVSNLLSAVFVMPMSASVLIAGKLDLWQNALPTLRPLQPLCYLRFSCNRGLKSCKSLCEDMQVGSAVQETVFSEKVARYDCLRVEFHCMLHGGSSIVRSSSVRIGLWLRSALYLTPQRNRQIYSLRHRYYVALFDAVSSNYTKSREDDPTAQCVCNYNDSKTRKRSGKKS